MTIKIQASQRLAAAKRDPVLQKLCDDLCDYEDDQMCDVDAGDEIEFYAKKSYCVKALKALGFKGSGDLYEKGDVKLSVKAAPGHSAKNTTYIRVA
jgi:hypothetical protein